MTNLQTIETKLNNIENTVHNLCYNFDGYEYEAEKLYLAGERPADEAVQQNLDHIAKCRSFSNKSFPNFDKLTEEERKYYATVDCLRRKAVENSFN